MKTIKVHYYDVSLSDESPLSLDADLITLSSLPLEDRAKICGHQEIRLDSILDKTDPDTKERYWLLRFSRFRNDNWPGVATREAESRDLIFDDDSVLAEETTMLYSETYNKALVQYNHIGVRVSKIQEYLSLSKMQEGISYKLIPVITAEALRKYQQKQIVTSVEASIEGISDADIAYFGNSSLKGTIQQSVDSKATSAKFNFSVDARIKTEKLDRSWVERVVDKVMGRSGERDRLLVSAKEAEGDALEVLNLLEARKVTEYDGEQIERTEGRRYKSDQLEALLEQAYKEWRSSNFQN